MPEGSPTKLTLYVLTTVTPELPPNVSVFVPPRNSFSGNHPRTSQLICQASGFSPRTIVMSWLQRGEPVQPSLVSTSAVEAEPKGSGPTTFRVISRLTITENEWLSQKEFTCQALHKGLTFQKNVSSVCMGDGESHCPLGEWVGVMWDGH